MAKVDRLRRRIKNLLRQAEFAEAELQKRIAAKLDPFYSLLSEDDLKHIIGQDERGLWVESLINDYVVGHKLPSELRRELYGDVPAPQVAIQAPAPIAQPVIEPQAPELPAIEPMPVIQAPVMAGLVRAKFIGKLAPGSLTVNDAIAGQKPLNQDASYLFEQSYFNRLRSIWPASWWTVES